MTQESEPKVLRDWRSWWPWAAAAGWLIMIFVVMVALGGFRDLFVDRGATATAKAETTVQVAEETKIAQQGEIAAAVLATLTAQPTPTPTEKPTETLTATARPSPTYTLTPDLVATRQAEASRIAAAIAATEAAKPTDTPAPTATPTATPDAAVTEAALRSLIVQAITATRVAEPPNTPVPTATFTATPDAAATETAVKSQIAAAIAATEAAKPADTPVPTATFTATPDAVATETAVKSQIAAAIAATEAAKPTDTPVPTATFTATPDAAATETVVKSQIAAAIAATEAAKPTDTPIPTATFTATPDAAATATAEFQLVAESVAATLTAQPTSTPTPIPALGWPLALADSFASSEYGWPVEESDDGLGRVSRQITDGAYRWEIEAEQGLLVLSHPNAPLVSDFYVAVEAEKLDGPVDAEYGLAFREADRDNFYSLGIRDGQFAAFRRLNGEWTALIDWTESAAIHPDKKNKLAVWGQEAKLAFFINDQLVGEAEDDSLPAGEIGLLAEVPAESRSSFEFDTLELRTGGELRLPIPVPSITGEATVLADKEEECLEENSPIFPKGSLLACDSFSSSWNLEDSDSEQLKEVRTVESGKYRWSIETENGLFSQASPSIGPVNDFYLSVEAQQIDGPSDAERSLMFRKVDNENLYTFSVRDDGSFGVFAIVNGEWATVVDWTPSPLVQPGEMTHLTIRATGRHVVFFINDQRVAESDAISPVEGEVGIAVSMGAETQGVFDFDNFELRTPAGERPRLLSSVEPGASGCAHDSVLAPAGWPVIFCNSFESDRTLNRLLWPLGESSNEFANAQRQIAYGRYIWDIKAFQGVFSPAISELADLTDFYLTAQGQVKSGPHDAAYGVLFRYVDGRNFYFFEISDSGFYQLSLKNDGEWETLIPWTEHNAIRTGKQQNRITVSASGDEFLFYINDENVTQYKDSRLESGGFGLAAELFNENDKGKFEWDNFGVWVPTEETGEEPQATAIAQPEPAEIPVSMSTFRSESLGVELQFPSGWSYLDLDDPPIALFGWFQGNAKGLKNGAILVVGSDEEFVDADVSELVEDLQGELGEEIKVEATEPRSIDDNVAKGLRVEALIPEESEFMAGQRVVGVMYVFARGNVGYLVAALSPDLSAWEAYEPTFNMMLDSIVLSDLPTPTPTPTWPPTNTPTVTPTPLPTSTPTPTLVPTSTVTPLPKVTAQKPSAPKEEILPTEMPSQPLFGGNRPRPTATGSPAESPVVPATEQSEKAETGWGFLAPSK